MAGSFVSGVKAAVPKLQGSEAERGQACAEITSLLVNANGRDVLMMEIALAPLLAIAGQEPRAMKTLATAGQGLWGTHAYPECLACLDACASAPSPDGAALSRKNRPWDDWSIPYTRQQELAMSALWRFECLLAVGRFDEALEREPDAIAGAAILPRPFKLSASIMEWGDAQAFVLRARIRAVRALRLRASGKDANAFRKVRQKDRPDSAEAARLRRLATELSERSMPMLDEGLGGFAPYADGGGAKLPLDERRALQTWRAEGYAEAGLLARDAGDASRAQRLLSTARWLIAVTDPSLSRAEPEHADAIRAANVPAEPLPGASA